MANFHITRIEVPDVHMGERGGALRMVVTGEIFFANGKGVNDFQEKLRDMPYATLTPTTWATSLMVPKSEEDSLPGQVKFFPSELRRVGTKGNNRNRLRVSGIMQSSTEAEADKLYDKLETAFHHRDYSVSLYTKPLVSKLVAPEVPEPHASQPGGHIIELTYTVDDRLGTPTLRTRVFSLPNAHDIGSAAMQAASAAQIHEQKAMSGRTAKISVVSLKNIAFH